MRILNAALAYFFMLFIYFYLDICKNR